MHESRQLKSRIDRVEKSIGLLLVHLIYMFQLNLVREKVRQILVVMLIENQN
jgi:hypothetical protein